MKHCEQVSHKVPNFANFEVQIREFESKFANLAKYANLAEIREFGPIFKRLCNYGSGHTVIFQGKVLMLFVRFNLYKMFKKKVHEIR